MSVLTVPCVVWVVVLSLLGITYFLVCCFLSWTMNRKMEDSPANRGSFMCQQSILTSYFRKAWFLLPFQLLIQEITKMFYSSVCQIQTTTSNGWMIVSCGMFTNQRLLMAYRMFLTTAPLFKIFRLHPKANCMSKNEI